VTGGQFVFEQERKFADRRMMRREPAGELQHEPARGEQQRLGAFHARLQFEPRFERRRRTKCLARVGRLSVRLREPLQNALPEAARDALARQTTQIGERRATDLLEHVAVRVRRWDERYGQLIEYVHERRLFHDAYAPRDPARARVRQQPRAPRCRRAAHAGREATSFNRRCHSGQQRAQSAEEPHAGADFEQYRIRMREHDFGREREQRQRNGFERVLLLANVDGKQRQLGRERERMRARAAGPHAEPKRDEIGHQDARVIG